MQTSKSQENDRLHVTEPHAAPKACESIASLKGYSNSLQASRSESDLPSIMGVAGENSPHQGHSM